MKKGEKVKIFNSQFSILNLEQLLDEWEFNKGSTIYEYILKQMNKPKDQLNSDFVSMKTVSVD